MNVEEQIFNIIRKKVMQAYVSEKEYDMSEPNSNRVLESLFVVTSDISDEDKDRISKKDSFVPMWKMEVVTNFLYISIVGRDNIRIGFEEGWAVTDDDWKEKNKKSSMWDIPELSENKVFSFSRKSISQLVERIAMEW